MYSATVNRCLLLRSVIPAGKLAATIANMERRVSWWGETDFNIFCNSIISTSTKVCTRLHRHIIP
jgi:hypothetical protein